VLATTYKVFVEESIAGVPVMPISGLMSWVFPTSAVESVVAPFTRNVTYQSGDPPASVSNA
jgi:hypothetical protein